MGVGFAEEFGIKWPKAATIFAAGAEFVKGKLVKGNEEEHAAC